VIVRGHDSDDSKPRRAALRRPVIEAVDAERARVARDLHYGAQQQLVNAVIALKLARRALQDGDEASEELVSVALEQAEQAHEQLGELARRGLPWALNHGGLRAAVEALASRAPLPVVVDVSVGRLAPAIEAHAYVIIAEALANIVEQSRASAAEVRAALVGDVLRLTVVSDGIENVRPGDRTRLLPLEERVASIGGRVRITSSLGGVPDLGRRAAGASAGSGL
jgi:signal transduction histidine kinase